MLKMQTLALFFLAALSIGGVAWVFLLPILSGEKKMEKRKASVARNEPVAARVARGHQRSRREQVEISLKEIEARQKKNQKPGLQVRIAQAGLSWSQRQFFLTAA